MSIFNRDLKIRTQKRSIMAKRLDKKTAGTAAAACCLVVLILLIVSALPDALDCALGIKVF